MGRRRTPIVAALAAAVIDAPAAKLADVVTPSPVTTPTVDVETVTAARRADELSTARKRYLTIMGGSRVKGGGDLVGRSFRALATFGTDKIGNKRNKFAVHGANDIVTLSDVSDGCKSVDIVKLKTWAAAYVSGLVQNDNTKRRLKVFSEFLDNGGFDDLALALDTFIKYSAFNFSESFTAPGGRTLVYVVDVRRDINDIFGIKLTNSRRARLATIVAE